MERRRYARIAVNLNVALLDDRAMPRGCRVRDVSAGGMLLQFEHPGSGTPYEPGQMVQVRASLKDGEQRRVLLLPAAVRRVEEKGIGVEFAKAEAALMKMLEPYQLDREIPAGEPAMAAAQSQAAAGSTVHAFAAARPRHHGVHAGARLAERIAAAREAIASAGHLGSDSARSTTAAPASGRDRRMLHVGLVSLAIAAAVIIFDLAASSSTRQRLAALENTANRQAEVLADVQIRLRADRDPERLARLDSRVNQLAASIAALETGPLASAEGKPVAPATDVQRQDRQAEAAAATPPPANQSATSSSPPPSTQPATTSDDGPWVINLVSLYDQTAADRFSQRARSAGIDVTQNRAEVKGRPVWRLQVAGFATRDAALAYSEANIHKLGVKKVWIFRR